MAQDHQMLPKSTYKTRMKVTNTKLEIEKRHIKKIEIGSDKYIDRDRM